MSSFLYNTRLCIKKLNQSPFQRLDVGTVWVNCWLVRSLSMPFGGVKGSGVGREGIHHSMDLYTEEKTVCVKYA